MPQNQRKYDHEYKVQAVKLAKEIGGGKAANLEYASISAVGQRSPDNETRNAGASHQASKNGKQAAAIFFVSRWKEVKPSLKYRLIEQYAGKYSIEKMCKFYGVSRSGYYRDQQRKDLPAMPR